MIVEIDASVLKNDQRIALLCGAGVAVDAGLPTADAIVRQFVASLLVASADAVYNRPGPLTDDQRDELLGDVAPRLRAHRMEYIFAYAESTPGVTAERLLAGL